MILTGIWFWWRKPCVLGTDVIEASESRCNPGRGPAPEDHCCCCCWVTSVVSDSVWPHRQQPTRPRHPWGSPGKNTAVGCHFLLQCLKVKSESEVAQSCLTLWDPMDCSLPGCSVHGIFQARVLEWGGVGCHCLFHRRPRMEAWPPSSVKWVQSLLLMQSLLSPFKGKAR